MGMKLAGQMGESKNMVRKRKKKAYDENRRRKRAKKAVKYLEKETEKKALRAAQAINKHPISDRKRLVRSAQSAANRPKGQFMANTYSALTSSILTYTNNVDSDELAAERDSIIRRSQLKMSRDLANMLALDVVATATVNSGDSLVNLPTSAVLVRSVRMIDTSGTAIPLQKREFEYCKDYWPNATLLVPVVSAPSPGS